MVQSRRMMRLLKYIACVLVLVCGVIPAQETGGQAERKQLEDVQQQIRKKRSILDKISGKERSLLDELRAIDKQLQEAQQQLAEYRRQVAENEQDLQKITKRISALKTKNAQNSTMLATRLRAIYKMGDLGYLGPLLSLSSKADTRQQLMYLQQLAADDKELLKQSESHIQAILKEQEALNQRKRDIVEAQQKIEQQSGEILAQQKQKTALLAGIQNDKQQHQKLIEELQRSAMQLDKMIQKFESFVPAATPQATSAPEQKVTIPTDSNAVVQAYKQYFRSNKGKLLWPVQGQIFTKYGRIQIGDTFTQYKGVDIRADLGTPFYAVFNGTIKFADWFDGYGNLIIVDHGGEFFTLYAHASEILVASGDVVESRQVLGKIGDTDSVKGPHLYFEIRSSGTPEDPQKWLAKLR